MCGRFANHVNDMHRWVELLRDWPADIPTGFNVGPTQSVPVVTREAVQAMRWGLIPAWSKESRPKYATFNARLESVAEKPAFRQPWKKQQNCLIPILGYYEWKTTSAGKRAYFVQSDEVGHPLAMAGLWEQRAGEYSFTVLTEPAADNMQSLHSRMPVMLSPQTAELWLAGKLELKLEDHRGLRVGMQYYRVKSDVNNVRNQGAQLIAPDEQEQE